jgi:hypothetical protein
MLGRTRLILDRIGIEGSGGLGRPVTVQFLSPAVT